MKNINCVNQDIIIHDIAFRNKDGKWKVFEEEEERPEEFESVFEVDKSHRFFILKLADKNELLLIDCNRRWNRFGSIYKSITFYREDRVLVEDTESRWGFISTQIEFGPEKIIPCIFDAIKEREDGLFDIQKKGAWGIIDLDGRFLVPMSFKRPIRKDFLSYSGIEVEETSGYSFSDFRSYQGLKGLYRYDKGHIENIIPPFYSDIFIPKRECDGFIRTKNGGFIRKQRICDFIFCAFGTEVEHPDYPDFNDDRFFACRDGFIDCYTLGGKKLSGKYQCYYLTEDGNFVFAGKNGELEWYTDDCGFSRLESFSGSYDLIDSEGNIQIEGIPDFCYCEENIMLLNFKFLFHDFWIILTNGNQIIKAGCKPKKIKFPFDRVKHRKKLSPYQIDIHNDLEPTLIENGYSQHAAQNITRYVIDKIHKKEKSDYGNDTTYHEVPHERYHDEYERDSWDAMTDGMYGDMPDGFDGDYDFLGR